YVWIAESDDFADVRFLEVLIAILEKDSSLGMAFCKSEVVDEEGKTINQNQNAAYRGASGDESFTMSGMDFLQRLLYYKCVIPNVSSALLKRETIEKVNFIPERY